MWISSSADIFIIISVHVHSDSSWSRGRTAAWSIPRGHVEGRWTIDSGLRWLHQDAPQRRDLPGHRRPAARGFTNRDQKRRRLLLAGVHRPARLRHPIRSTVVDVETTRLTVRQVSAEGEELDRFTITRDSRQ